jgi:DNA-binding GntR family transcriptional regulator
MANHKPKSWQGIDIKRGQVVTGLKSLNKATGISTQTLRTCLSKLEKSGNLTSKSTNKYRVITICNYETYQIEETSTNKPANKQLTINQQSTNNQLTPNKKVKNKENEKNDKDLNNSLDFTADGSFNFKKLFTDEFKPINKFERNTLNKLAKDYGEQHKGLKHAHIYIIDKIEDLRLMCREQGKNRTDAIKIFVSQIKKEL